MADPKKMSVADILAACRNRDGEGSAEPAVNEAQPPPTAAESVRPASTKPTPAAKPASGKKPGEMSVAEMLAAARAEKSGGAQPAAAPKSATATATGADKPAAGGKKPSQMSVQEMLAAARAEKAGGSAKEKPTAAAKPKPKAAVAKKASPQAPAKPTHTGPKDTSSILAAARKADKPGPMSKAEAATKAQPAAPAKAKAVAPPMPSKPEYAKPKPKKAAAAEEGRRGFISIFFGSFLAVGFSSLTLTNVLWGLGLARFFFPNILTEPPNRFKVGFPGDFAPGSVDAKFKAQFGIWLVNAEYEGQPQIVALKTVCTHLGCTPNWLEAEQKFKCPCHGSGFYKDGINFEGPAPRPLERYAISIADDGQLEVDKSRTFQEEMGQWSDPSSFVPA